MIFWCSQPMHVILVLFYYHAIQWTREEEEYVDCLIDEFKTGMMPLAEGTSLRTFLRYVTFF